MPHTKRAFDAVEQLIPQFKRDCGEFKTFLYVGWCAGQGPKRGQTEPWWHDVFAKEMGISSKITVLDIFAPNIAELDSQIWAGRYNADTLLGDIRNIENLCFKKRYDIIFLDHCPEHINLDDLKSVTEKLKEWSNKLVLYACPWGEWVQGPMDGNKHEEHLSSIYPETLADMGMTVLQLGAAHQTGEGELIAYYYCK